MISKKQIGVFWGNDFLSVAEMQSDKLAFTAAIPRKNPEKPESSPEPANAASSQNIYLTAAVQRFIRERKITNPVASIAIPTHEILFRSFVLPAMNPEETENAIIFEAPRYVPFKLSDLFFSYHTSLFTEKNVKRTRVLFLAVRKSTLNEYCKIFEDAQIEVRYAEPSVFALFQILTVKKLIKPNRPIAIVQINDAQGSIMIADQQLPQFIRDFNLFPRSASLPTPDFKSITAKIANEVRISLDFYNRQLKTFGRENPIEKIYLFGGQDINTIAHDITKETGIDATFLDVNEIFPYESQLHPGVANAVGAALSSHNSPSSIFDLARARKLEFKKGSAKGFKSFLQRSPNYNLTALVAAISIAAVFIAWSKAYLTIAPTQKKLIELKAFDEKYKNMTTDAVKASIANIQQKITAYTDFRFKSTMRTYVENISQCLPDGAWLQALTIKTADPSKNATETKNEGAGTETTVGLDGYTYDPQLEKQITLVESFLKNLKNNDVLKTKIKNIDLKTVKKETQRGFSVTHFQIDLVINEANTQ